MKTAFFSLLAIALASAIHAEPPQKAGADGSLRVAIIDDFTGTELADEGIEPVSVEQLDALVKALCRQPAEAAILFTVIDGNNGPAESWERAERSIPKFAFAASKIDEGALRGTLVDQRRAQAAFQAEIKAFLPKVKSFREDVSEVLEGFCADAMKLQSGAMADFAKRLSENGGSDFNRSDVAGTLVHSALWAAEAERAFICLNTDAIDLPGEDAGRKPRTTPFTAKELPPHVELVFINTTRAPQKEPIFEGIGNKVHQCASLSEAVALIAESVGSPAPKAEPDAGPASDR